MEPVKFRQAMEKLGAEYELPVGVLQNMIFELGVISQTVARDRGEEVRDVYLQVQYETFKRQLADPRFVAAVKRSAAQQYQEQDSSE